MALVLPNLDDKPFEQIADEARQLIPVSAPEWTDHNVHDPGITFVELFAWLAEIQRYRLNRTAASSYERFFSLMGLTAFTAKAAEVVVQFAFDRLDNPVFLPANTRLTPIGVESIPFETNHDQYLTRAKLSRIVTLASGREIVQTTADTGEVGYYEAFGSAPEIGDFLLLEFVDWFTEPLGQLEITLFEDDLPKPGKALTQTAPGFEPSANIVWEYRKASAVDPNSEWEALEIVRDGTLNFSRSRELIFKVPTDVPAQNQQIRAVLRGGRFEIPPRIVAVRTNTIRARQVETIVNESIAGGLGRADQIVRLQKAPLFVSQIVDDGPVQVGEVVDWKALVNRLNNIENYPSPKRETLRYVLSQLSEQAREIISSRQPPNNLEQPADQEKYELAQAFNALIERADFYQREQFKDVDVPEELLKAVKEQRCQKTNEVRRTNRFVLQTVFRDLFVGDRLEIQTSVAGASGDDEGLIWLSWDPVESLDKSGPDDLHYIVDAQTGVIRFGNGLNGRVPNTSELIRARFYRYSQMEKGNLPSHRQWRIEFPLPANTVVSQSENLTAATGGRQKETIDETKSRAREVFRKETAILTAKDYERLVLSTPGLRVARLKVVPNSNPKLPCLKLPGEVTIIVLPQPAPKAAFPNATPPEPSEGFLNTIRNYLESRRLVTTNIHVIGPHYQPVNVACSVFLKKRASATEALKSIREKLADFFDPVFGGPEAGKGWPFGRPVFPSEVSQQLAKLPTVDYVTNIRLNDQKPGEPLKLLYNGLPTFGTPAITTVPFEERGRVAVSNCEGDRCD